MTKHPLNRPFAGLKQRLARQQEQREQEQRAQEQRAQEQRAQEERAQEERMPASFADLAMQDQVTPLPHARERVARQPDHSFPPVPPAPAPPTELFEVERLPRGVTGRRLDVDPMVVEVLRGARPRTRLDLHGQEAEPARRRLHRFIVGRHARGDRELLVIVGKGRHSPGGRGVLRDEVADWLTEPRIARYVRAFVTARREHGGEGAVYVALSR